MQKRDKTNRPPLHPDSHALIALTGNIASGKSAALSIIAGLGYLTFNSDAVAKEGLNKSQAVKDYLNTSFSNVLTPSGEIDFNILSGLAFKNPDLLAFLQKHSHPYVLQKRTEFIKRNQDKSIIFEIPLLFEKNMHDYFDYVILLTADKNIALERALQRKGMTHEKFHDILANQAIIKPDDPRVDVHFHNSGDILELKKKILEVFNAK